MSPVRAKLTFFSCSTGFDLIALMVKCKHNASKFGMVRVSIAPSKIKRPYVSATFNHFDQHAVSLGSVY